MTTPAVDFALAAGAVIEGTVTDVVTGLPLQNMNVRVVDQSGAYVTYGNTDAAGDYTSQDGLVPGIYHVWVSYCPGYVRQVHGGGYCHPLSCNVTGGTPVDLTGGGTAVVDIALTPGGAVSGTVTDADTGAGLLNAYLVLHDAAGVPLTYTWSTITGDYEFQTASPPGDYHLVTYHSDDYFTEVYDNIPCSGCDITAGTPIPVAAGVVTTAIDVDLRRGGMFSGRVTRSGSLTPVAGAEIRIHDGTGTLVATVVTDADGEYAVADVLPTGSYFAKTFNDQGYVDELYSNIACPGDTCDPTTGTPIVLADGQVLPGRDFGLSVGGSLSGTVTEAGSIDPIAGAEIRVYDGSGAWAATAVSAADGTFTVGGLNTGSWYAVTVSPDHLDQAYGGLPCDGGCDPTIGTPLSVVTGVDTPGVDFVLEIAPLFGDGFESGDLAAWSSAVP
jgi:hypothetical protein